MILDRAGVEIRVRPAHEKLGPGGSELESEHAVRDGMPLYGRVEERILHLGRVRLEPEGQPAAGRWSKTPLSEARERRDSKAEHSVSGIPVELGRLVSGRGEVWPETWAPLTVTVYNL